MKTNHTRGLFFALFMALAGNILYACDFCGAYLGITPFDNQSTLSLTHRYRVFNGYPAMSQSSSFFPSGAYRVAPTYSPLHGTGTDSMNMDASDFESYKIIELRGRLFIHPRFELNFLLPFVNNKSRMGDETYSVAGLGDVSFFAAYHILQQTDPESFRYRLIGGLGIKIPTGKNNAAYEDGDRASLMMQPGTGSVDGFLYVSFTSAAKNWRWGVNSVAKVNGENKYDEQISPSTVNNAFIGYQATSCSWTFLPQVTVYQEYTNGYRVNNVQEVGTRMNMILAGVGLDVYKGRFGFCVGGQLPVYQQTDEMNMDTAGRLLVGVSYSFKQQKYLFE